VKFLTAEETPWTSVVQVAQQRCGQQQHAFLGTDRQTDKQKGIMQSPHLCFVAGKGKSKGEPYSRRSVGGVLIT